MYFITVYICVYKYRCVHIYIIKYIIIHIYQYTFIYMIHYDTLDTCNIDTFNTIWPFHKLAVFKGSKIQRKLWGKKSLNNVSSTDSLRNY